MTPRHYLFLITLFFLTTTVQAQFNMTRIAPDHLPKDVLYRAKVKDAFTWKDSSGSYTLVITETGSYDAPSGEGNDAEVYAWCYENKGGAHVLLWKLNDHVSGCQVDLSAEYITNATKLTDLDRDGVAEVWLTYRTACRGDVSPATMKIVMHEGKAKYAVRGTSRVKVSKVSYAGGEMTLDEALTNGPEAFRTYAKKLWSEHVTENWDE